MVGNLKKLQDNLRRLENDIPKIMAEVAAEQAEIAVGVIKKRTPVRIKKGGLLRRSWHSEPPIVTGDLVTATISNNTEYAPYVENGHRIVDKNGKTIGYVKGRYMMRNGLQFYKENLMKKRINQSVIKRVEKYFK